MKEKKVKSVKINESDHSILSHHLIDYKYVSMADALSKAITLLIFHDKKNKSKT